MAKIERGIEPPEVPRERGRYPWADLDIGDSFIAAPGSLINSVQTQCSRAGRRLGMRFMARLLLDTEPVGQIRVWRIK